LAVVDIMRWGWLAGLLLMAVVLSLRGTKNPFLALLPVGLILGGMLLLAASAGLQLGGWLKSRRQAAPSVIEIRRAAF
jgi:hypothetical protein